MKSGKIESGFREHIYVARKELNPKQKIYEYKDI